MRILHTSDWHLGRTLYNRARYEEFEAFLNWLTETLEREQIDVLLVAGDVFDNTTPSHRAQALYYRFLHAIANSVCRHVVVIAGNHDSPSLLDAPQALLRYLNVHVLGGASDNPVDEVLSLSNADGKTELIVCAVPYLRDRDIRKAEAGESLQDKERKLLDGIREHYQTVGALAEQIRAGLASPVPIIALGHLFAAGGKTVEGDGVRDLYVGSLAHVGADIFPSCIDYLALGHLHVAQKVAGQEHMRYSGSPIPMGFGEANQRKVVLLVEFTAAGEPPVVKDIAVPRWQALERIGGDWQTIQQRLQTLRAEQSQAWLEITYDGAELIGDLRAQLDELIADTRLEILRVKNKRLLTQTLHSTEDAESLDELNPLEVFQRCLDAHEVTSDDRPALETAYREVISALQHADSQAE
ncbi:MAG: exonuclease SbcCD subunit D C-terminal domain-containing protein [Gammaproteobacteria bacterium]